MTALNAKFENDSRDSRNMSLRESGVTLAKFDEILPLILGASRKSQI